jgi:hypothetical protein
MKMDVETAKRECRTWLDECQGQIERLRQLVETSDTLAPDSLRVSVEESTPGLRRAAKAAVAWLQMILQIRAGDMHYGESGDLR